MKGIVTFCLTETWRNWRRSGVEKFWKICVWVYVWRALSAKLKRILRFYSVNIYQALYSLCCAKICGYLKKIQAARSLSSGSSLCAFCRCHRCPDWSRLDGLLDTFGQRRSGLWFGSNNLKVICEINQNVEDLGSTPSNVSRPNFTRSEKDIS